MIFLKDVADFVCADVSVNLRGRNRAVPKQLLDVPDVDVLIHKSRCKSMPEHMRRNVQPCPCRFGIIVYHTSYGLLGIPVA